MIRTYEKTDQARLLEIFQENTPSAFDPSELADLRDYLNNSIEIYYVLEKDGIIAGAGGINFFEGKRMASLSWDFISPTFQGQGLGSELARFRIQVIKEIKSVKTIRVRTTQISYQFYEKMGFQLQHIVKDFWANGYDLYYMEMTVE